MSDYTPTPRTDSVWLNQSTPYQECYDLSAALEKKLADCRAALLDAIQVVGWSKPAWHKALTDGE